MNKQKCLFFSFLFLGLIVALGVSAVCATDSVSMNESVTLDPYGEIIPVEEIEKIEIKENNKYNDYNVTLDKYGEIVPAEEIEKIEIKENPIEEVKKPVYPVYLDELEKADIDGQNQVTLHIISPNKGVLPGPDYFSKESDEIIQYELDHFPNGTFTNSYNSVLRTEYELDHFPNGTPERFKKLAVHGAWYAYRFEQAIVNWGSKLVMFNSLVGNPYGYTPVPFDELYADGFDLTMDDGMQQSLFDDSSFDHDFLTMKDIIRKHSNPYFD